MADTQVAEIETKYGNMVVEFFPNDAPQTVANFINLTENGFYDSTRFHRIIPDFMIQGGDPLSKDANKIQDWGTGGSGTNLNAEFNNIKHLRGIVSMARARDINSASSQFFIVQKDSTYLDKQYTAFGRLITEESFKVLDSIASLQTNHNGTNGVPLDAPIDLDSAQIKTIKIKNLSEISNPLKLGDPERIISHSSFENGNYTNTLYGLTFQAPSGWIFQEPPKTQPQTPDAVLVNPQDPDFNAVIALLVQDKNKTSLDDHVKETKKNLQQLIDAGRLKILSENSNKFKGFNAHETNANGTFALQNKIFLIHYKEIVFEDNNKFYTLTYTNQEKNFESNLVSFNEVLDSFKLNSVPNSTSSSPDMFSNGEMDTSWIGIGIGVGAAVVAAIVILKRKPKSPQQPTSKKE